MDYPKGIRPDGAGLRIRLWKNGRPVYSETIKGDPTSKTLISAAQKRREWLVARQKLGLPLFDDEISESQDFSSIRKDFIASLDAKRSTAMSYSNIIKRYWSNLDNVPANEIRPADIKRILASHNVGWKTKRNALSVLKAALDHAEVFPNPCLRVTIKRGQKAPVDRYTPDETTALMDELSGQESVYFALLFGCGLRPAEALGILWTDYDGEELDISKQIVRRRLEPTTKTNMRRRVYVPLWVRPYLNNHSTRFVGGHVFQNSQGNPHLDTDVFNKAWRKAHTKARIPYRIPYTCRHTRASELLTTGVEPPDAAIQLGHSVEMFFRVYAEWIDEMKSNKDKARFEGYDRKATDKNTLNPKSRTNTSD